MNRSSAQRNLESLLLIANRLDELCNEVTFVGGCITGLLITDKAAPDVRFTIDVDCIINVVSKQEYHSLSEELRQKGFKEMPFGDHPICRWDCDGILIDVMPTDKNILGFSNKWYKDAQENAVLKNLNTSKVVSVISAPYFLATKLEAFKDRGKLELEKQAIMNLNYKKLFLYSAHKEAIIQLAHSRSHRSNLSLLLLSYH